MIPDVNSHKLNASENQKAARQYRPACVDSLPWIDHPREGAGIELCQPSKLSINRISLRPFAYALSSPLASP
jgi:hypothetical protein